MRTKESYTLLLIFLIAIVSYLLYRRYTMRCVEGLSKNNYGTQTVRTPLGVVQGGGNYPYVY